jgi:hypothetical protein
MKLLRIILLSFMVLTILPIDSYADAWFSTRRKCRSWRKKYKAVAKIKRDGNILWYKDKDTGCTWAHAFESASDYNCNGDWFLAAEAEADARSSGSYATTYTDLKVNFWL